MRESEEIFVEEQGLPLSGKLVWLLWEVFSLQNRR